MGDVSPRMMLMESGENWVEKCYRFLVATHPPHLVPLPELSTKPSDLEKRLILMAAGNRCRTARGDRMILNTINPGIPCLFGDQAANVKAVTKEMWNQFDSVTQ